MTRQFVSRDIFFLVLSVDQKPNLSDCSLQDDASEELVRFRVAVVIEKKSISACVFKLTSIAGFPFYVCLRFSDHLCCRFNANNKKKIREVLFFYVHFLSNSEWELKPFLPVAEQDGVPFRKATLWRLLYVMRGTDELLNKERTTAIARDCTLLIASKNDG